MLRTIVEAILIAYFIIGLWNVVVDELFEESPLLGLTVVLSAFAALLGFIAPSLALILAGLVAIVAAVWALYRLILKPLHIHFAVSIAFVLYAASIWFYLGLKGLEIAAG
jgi:hypothetical protein